ncbi:hypothetical protein RUND412_000844, partial [Rhizina undulata]
QHKDLHCLHGLDHESFECPIRTHPPRDSPARAPALDLPEHLQSKYPCVQATNNTKVEPQVKVIRKLNLPSHIDMLEDPRFKGFCHRWLDRPDYCTKELCIFKHANPLELVKEYGFVMIGVKSVRNVDELGSAKQGCPERSLRPGSLPQACRDWAELGQCRFMERLVSALQKRRLRKKNQRAPQRLTPANNVPQKYLHNHYVHYETSATAQKLKDTGINSVFDFKRRTGGPRKPVSETSSRDFDDTRSSCRLSSNSM